MRAIIALSLNGMYLAVFALYFASSVSDNDKKLSGASYAWSSAVSV